MTVIDNTVLAEGSSDFFKQLGENGFLASKKISKTFSENQEEL